MKKIILLGLCFLITVFSFSQETKEEPKGTDLKTNIRLLNEELKKTTSLITKAKKELTEVNKTINTINKGLVEINKKEQIEELKKTKDNNLLRKITLQEDIIELTILSEKQKKEIVIMKEASDFVIADGTLNWKKDFDINNPKFRDGKWHLEVKARDNYNNYSETKKINIKLNKKSDIPGLSIINPLNFARVTSNLKIAGTATDDDGIQKVVLFIDEDTKEIKCNGTEFWYYDLDTKELTEGNHRLKFKVFDIKGVESKFYFINFKLDKFSPKITIQSKPEKVIISGKINIAGGVKDGNGISNTEYSVDSRVTFNKASKIKFNDKEKKDSLWEVNLDSQNLVDGLATIWIKATDNTGSESFESITFLIDHRSPEIVINYPLDKDKVDGTFKVFGYAEDNVGLSKINLEIKGSGGEVIKNEIKLKPGNPFWSQEINMENYKDGTYQLTLTALDLSENIRKAVININLENNLDKPVLSVKSLNKGDKFSSFISLSGTITDDDNPKEVNLKLIKDSQTIIEENIPSKYSFYKNIDITDFNKFKEGVYTVELVPVDIKGIKGDKFTETIYIERSFPVFDSAVLNTWAGKTFSKKIDFKVNVIKFGELKNLSYSIVDPENYSDILNKKSVSFKKGKDEGVYESDLVSVDMLKEKPDRNGLVLVKLEAADSNNRSASVLVPVIIDSLAPEIIIPGLDNSKNELTSLDTVEIKDNLMLTNLTVNITSGEKEFQAISDTILPNDKKEYKLNPGNTEGKKVEYNLTLEALDLAGNPLKKSIKVNFKNPKDEPYSFKISVPGNNNLTLYKEQKIFLSGQNFNDFNLEANSSTCYIFIPGNIKKTELKIETLLKEASLVNKENGIFNLIISPDEKNKLAKGKIEGDWIITKSDDKKDTKKISLFNDVLNPYNGVIWPNPFLSFNKDIKLLGMVYDDSNNVDIEYITDSQIPKVFSSEAMDKIQSSLSNPIYKKILTGYFSVVNNSYNLKSNLTASDLFDLFTILESANYDLVFNKAVTPLIDSKNISKITVPSYNPLDTKNVLLTDYIKDQQIAYTDKYKIYSLDIPVQNLDNGEHLLVIKTKDPSGKESYEKTVFITDKIEPNVSIWPLLPKNFLSEKAKEKIETKSKDDKKIKDNVKTSEKTNEKTDPVKDTQKSDETKNLVERINGLITLRGDGSDNFKLSNIIIKYNNTEYQAIGNTRWEADYDLNNLTQVKIPKGEEAPYSIEVYAIDFAGNKKTIKKDIIIDKKQDVPVVLINKPAVNDQRYTEDIEIAGIAFDDDGIDFVQYRIDFDEKAKDQEAGWEKIEVDKTNGKWTKTLLQNSLSSKRHVLEIRAVDMYGLKSETKKIPFHLDVGNPIVTINTPKDGDFIKGKSTIVGTAADPNLIQKVEISTNYGWTYVSAAGEENWNYSFNTSNVPDGPLRILIKTKDKAGSEGFSFALFNVDNSSPEIDILLPKDGTTLNNKYRIVGRSKDNIGLESVKIKIMLNNKSVLKNTDKEDFTQATGKEAWFYDIDTALWEINKDYTLIARATDLSGNITETSLLFKINPDSDLPVVQLIQPQPSQHFTGEVINFFGTAFDDDELDSVFVKVDALEEVKVKGTKNWSYALPTINLKAGLHKLEVYAKEKNTDKPVISGKTIVDFFLDEAGPVVNVESHINGAPVEHRPWLKGTAYYYEKDIELKLKEKVQIDKLNKLKIKYRRTPELIPDLATIKVKKSEVDALHNKTMGKNKINSIFLSSDNGKSYKRFTTIGDKWKIRLQTQNFKNGNFMIQFKAVTNNSLENLEYFNVIIDRNLPEIIIDDPIENKDLNEKVAVRGSTNDNGSIEQVQIALKPFDKNLGNIPKFIQGIYLWSQFLAGPLVSGGFGLSFFNDVVRLEGVVGWTPTVSNVVDIGFNPENTPGGLLRTYLFDPTKTFWRPRFSGVVTGGKILAKVIDIPFEFFWGEDARNFSISAEIGAGFYWHSGWAGAKDEVTETYYKNKNEVDEKGKPQGYKAELNGKLVAGFMYQIDFFKVERLGPLRKFALYFEQLFYFIPSDTKSVLENQIGIGLRNAFF